MKENKKSKNNSVNKFIEACSYGHAESGVTPQRDLMRTFMRMNPNFSDITPQSVIDNCNVKISLKKGD